MSRLLAYILQIAAVALLATTTAHAEQSSTPATPPTAIQVERQISNYGDLDKTCHRWTDQCRACSRNADGGPNCSNIGIACQPAAIECTTRQEAADKK